ncbi:hypothetical protein GALMADRAFT_259566 [Galerina marginata CBS 339.88]|uniref:DUF6533 domain-containing protein n=1 Tax=Galerina marginata (strain CBS 339.88) TaxID=685588 RepID=A0A067S8N6_GALM3|nr:hypothetical protein GALMADRAFT_259566 [Galerina marginata CBS 339.88]
MSDSLMYSQAGLDMYRAGQITRYSELASACVILYDHLLTFDNEVKSIWTRKWSLPQVLFVISRYYVLASAILDTWGMFFPVPTDSFCFALLRWQGWTCVIVSVLAAGILQVKIYALYFLNKRILALMLTFFIGSVANSVWIMKGLLSKFQVKALSFPNGTFCVLYTLGIDDALVYAFWIPILAFEFLLFMLALIRGLKMVNDTGSRSLLCNGQQLIAILVRDSITYFIGFLYPLTSNHSTTHFQIQNWRHLFHLHDGLGIGTKESHHSSSCLFHRLAERYSQSISS